MSPAAQAGCACCAAPQVKAAPPRPMGKPGTTALIVRARNEQVEESVTSFVSNSTTTSPSSSITTAPRRASSRTRVVPQDHLRDDPRQTADEVAAARRALEDPDSQFSACAAFEIGYLAGKLGFARVVVLHTSPQAPFHDEYGMIYIPVDPADGWQLQLASHLKRAGVEVDMNRLC